MLSGMQAGPYTIGFFSTARVAAILWMVMAVRAMASPDSVVVFNELQYNPPGQSESGEWIELHNQMAVDIDLSRWELTGGVDYVFPEGTVIAGGGYLVIAQDVANPLLDAPLGPYSGRLDNAGETLRLRTGTGRLMDELSYDDSGFWPVAADGTGSTLAKLREDTASGPAEKWGHSAQTGGTPGAPNFSAPDMEIEWVGCGGMWRYNESGEDLGAGWAGMPHPVGGHWEEGLGALAYENDPPVVPIGTELTPVSDNNPRVITYYFETDFRATPEQIQDLEALRMTHAVDDGAVFYLNGVEIPGTRYRMDEGAVSSGTLASSGGEAVLVGPVTIPADALRAGLNRIAAEVHQASVNSSDIFFDLSLSARLRPPPTASVALQLTEIAPAGEDPFWIEFQNIGPEAVDLEGLIVSRNGDTSTEWVLPAGTLAAGAFLALYDTDLGFGFADDDKVVLYSGDRTSVIDARRVTNRLRGVSDRHPGRWLFPVSATPGEANHFTFTDDIVIHEIHYHAPSSGVGETFQTSDEEWIELYNRGAAPVDLAGWRFREGIEYEFPAGTSLGAGDYLVLAGDPVSFEAVYPGVAVAGLYDGRLANHGERIELRDAHGNPADVVRYHDGGRWPEHADGGGASMELRDPRADNGVAEAWAASNESGQTAWATYSYRATAQASPVGHDGAYEDFVLGMLYSGEVLIDDLSVVEEPDGSAIQLIANGGFDGLDTWRAVGNHRGSEVVPDPDDPGNSVLKIVARGPTEHLNNHIETTLAGGRSVVNGREYEISFRARWVAGSPLLNTRLFFNRAARTTLLDRPLHVGTPGAPNSRGEGNIGPTYSEVLHDPPVPPAGTPVTVSAIPADPDGVAEMTLYYAVEGAAFQAVPMTDVGDGAYQAPIPGQTARTVVQFYIQGRDGAGAASTFPARGAESRALIQFADGRQSTTGIHNLRIIATQADDAWMRQNINLMSNDPVPCTVIAGEREIYYDCGIRFRGSARGRIAGPNRGYKIYFGKHQRYRGIHDSVLIDGSGFSQYQAGSQLEMLHHQAAQHAGVIPAKINDLVYIIAPGDIETGPAELVLAGYKPEFLASQFDNGDDGTVFKYEAVYPQTGTNAEGYKFPTQSGDLDRITITDHGDSPEDYRDTFLIRNNRDQDDYRPIMAFAKFFDLSGEPFHAMVDEILDTDQFLKALAYTCATGGNDQYFTGNRHNGMFYVRPDGRILFFPHDIDRVGGTTQSITASADLQTIIDDPAKLRAYLGHLQDIASISFQPAYLQYWADHFSMLTGGQPFGTHMDYLGVRADNVLSQIDALLPPVDFAVTTHGGEPFSIAAPSATLDGDGWVNVREIRLQGSSIPLQVVWTGENTWQTSIPLQPGENTVVLEAVDFRGQLIGADAITITSTADIAPAGPANLAVSELMYNPPAPNAAESTAGFSDKEDFEFLELINFSANVIDLTGARFIEGIQFAFPAGLQLAPGETIVVPGNAAAFSLRYAGTLPANLTAGYQIGDSNRLSNGGETLVLVDAGGTEILRFTYDDANPWPESADGDGFSLTAIAPGAQDPDDAASWRPSLNLGGTPGFSDSQPYSGSSLAAHALYGSGTLQAARIGPDLALSFRRHLAADDVDFLFEYSTDLQAWLPMDPPPTLLSRTHHPDGTETLAFSTTGAANTQDAFLRLHIRLR